jgi:hypothetical protein
MACSRTVLRQHLIGGDAVPAPTPFVSSEVEKPVPHEEDGFLDYARNERKR